MTLSLPIASQGLQQIQFGPNEVLSTLILAKHGIGSLLGRENDAALFLILEAQYNIRGTGVPMWLEDIDLSRKTIGHATAMRHVESGKTMENIKIQSLEGIATFLVLCIKYTENVKISDANGPRTNPWGSQQAFESGKVTPRSNAST
jgi:hypothetical protein